MAGVEEDVLLAENEQIAKVLQVRGSQTVSVTNGKEEFLCLIKHDFPLRIVRNFFIAVQKGGLGRETQIQYEVSKVFVGRDLEKLKQSDKWPHAFRGEVQAEHEEIDVFEGGNPNKPKNFIIEESDSDT